MSQTFERSGWRVTSNKNDRGERLSDTPVLMRRPDGQPGEVQEQYVSYYEQKGYSRANALDFDDVIPSKLITEKPKSRKELREEMYRKQANAMTKASIMDDLSASRISYEEDMTKAELSKLLIELWDKQRKDKMK